MSQLRPAGPVLKWAGGKRQLLAQLRPYFPAHISRYFEPFLGSGALFFDLCASGRLRPSDAWLSDDNADLVGTYLRLCDSTDALLAELSILAECHDRDGREQYYRVRDQQFNPLRRHWTGEGGEAERYPVALAAMLLYLNRTGYNGLFRLNAAGAFNVPMGRYEAPRIVQSDRIRSAAAVLREARITRASFADALSAVRQGDVVYLDPPYAPLSATANFRGYTTEGFSIEDQRRLRDLVIRLAVKGAHVVLSNSTAEDVLSLYQDEKARSAGLACFRVRARRAINTNAARRGPIDELVVTNLPGIA